MRDLSLRHSYSSLQSKMAHLAMNGLLLQGHGLFCVFLLPLSSSNSLKVIHYYYILNAPVFFSLALPVPSEIWNGISTSQQHYCIHVPHWLLYFKVIFPQNLFRMPVLHYSHCSWRWKNPTHNTCIYKCNIILTTANDLRDNFHLDCCHYQDVFINLLLLFLPLVFLYKYFLSLLKLSFKFMLSSMTMSIS